MNKGEKTITSKAMGETRAKSFVLFHTDHGLAPRPPPRPRRLPPTGGPPRTGGPPPPRGRLIGLSPRSFLVSMVNRILPFSVSTQTPPSPPAGAGRLAMMAFLAPSRFTNSTNAQALLLTTSMSFTAPNRAVSCCVRAAGDICSTTPWVKDVIRQGNVAGSACKTNLDETLARGNGLSGYKQGVAILLSLRGYCGCCCRCRRSLLLLLSGRWCGRLCDSSRRFCRSTFSDSRTPALRVASSQTRPALRGLFGRGS